MLKEEGGEESGCQDVLGRLQVLMISTPKRGDLIFPKVRQQNHMIMHALTHTHPSINPAKNQHMQRGIIAQ